ncbi:MAG: primosomal protein N' [Muribaculaceae bacterium]|nr:primosomal protein N' [Muribaculaceae bacterium]
MMLIQVILPLPIQGTFTYSVPDDVRDMVGIGSRVLVQFGRKKYYTAIVSGIDQTPPQHYEVKPIMAVLDPHPALRYPQLKFWEWIADYYLCSVGDVMKAALPTGLKIESESVVTLNQEFDADDGIHLTERQSQIVAALQHSGKESLSGLEKTLGIKNVAPHVNALLASGVVKVDEKVVEKYRPKTVTKVRLLCDRNDDERLHSFFDQTKRSSQQQGVLLAYLDLSKFMVKGEEVRDVERDALLKACGVSPAVLKAVADKGIIEIYKDKINRFASDGEKTGEMPVLSDVQAKAAKEIRDSFRDHAITLLHGVTGSGKTEIYCDLIKEVLDQGNQVLYLVPEISLTTQLTDRLKKVFGNRLLIYHSKFSDSERVDIWNRLLASNEPMVVLGVRSSVFLPFARLGLVVVDEEHEASYKQYDPAPRYNARDAATVLASMHGARTLFGSATPSVETYWKAKNGKFGLVTLTERYEGSSLPEVEVVDMRKMRKQKDVKGILSGSLRRQTKEVLDKGWQAIMFQNRRGFAPVVVCHTCGWSPKCSNCDVSLVYHKGSKLLRCHYCGYTQTLPDLCPACEENTLEKYGYGTERIAEEVQEEFPDKKVSRMDLDTTRNKFAYQELIEEFAEHRTDILVGTQMVSKGLDFDKVKIVGVLNADTLLNFPDFRSNERAFNMLEQVAGRAGRRQEPGKVIIQTSKADERVLEHVKNHDYLSYYQEELEERQKYAYPPFTKIINVYVRNKDAAVCDAAAVMLSMELRKVFGSRVLGPEKPFVSRVNTWYIQQIMLKVESGASMKKVKGLLRQVYERLAPTPQIKSSQIHYDVDPV